MKTGKCRMSKRRGGGRVTYPLLLCLSAAGRSFFVMSLPMCVSVCVCMCVPGGCQNNRKQDAARYRR